MNKALKLVAVIGIVIVSLSLTYYFVVFLPHTERDKLALQKEEQTAQARKLDQDNSQKCATAGRIYFQNYKTTQDDQNRSMNITPNYFEEPKYHFNNRLQTCLVEIQYTLYFMGEDGVNVSQIKDVYGNKLIITSTSSANEKLNMNLSDLDYKVQSEQLMSE
jgi:hypothetical protein